MARQSRRCFCCKRDENVDRACVHNKKLCVECIRKIREIRDNGWILLPRSEKVNEILEKLRKK